LQFRKKKKQNQREEQNRRKERRPGLQIGNQQSPLGNA